MFGFGRPRGHRLLATLAGALLCAVFVPVGACGPPAPAEPYRNLFPTSQTAAQAAVDAIYARDTDRLRELAVTEVEFRKNIWPFLPASRPEVGMPFEYVWSDTSTKSQGYLLQTVESYGGRHRTVENVAFEDESTEYDLFTIHPESVVTVTSDDGTTEDLRLFGSMVETPQGWKIFSYVVD